MIRELAITAGILYGSWVLYVGIKGTVKSINRSFHNSYDRMRQQQEAAWTRPPREPVGEDDSPYVIRLPRVRVRPLVIEREDDRE